MSVCTIEEWSGGPAYPTAIGDIAVALPPLGRVQGGEVVEEHPLGQGCYWLVGLWEFKSSEPAVIRGWGRRVQALPGLG